MEPFTPDFLPEIETLDGPSILDQLPSHYLAHPTASNYIALGVVYTLMGLGKPEDLASPTYLDKTLMGVFTLLNSKSEELGLPSFDPPTPLSNDAIAKVAAILDNLMVISKSSELI